MVRDSLGLPTMREQIKEIRNTHKQIIGSTSSTRFRKCAMCRAKTIREDKIYCDECLYYGIPEGI